MTVAGIDRGTRIGSSKGHGLGCQYPLEGYGYPGIYGIEERGEQGIIINIDSIYTLYPFLYIGTNGLDRCRPRHTRLMARSGRYNAKRDVSLSRPRSTDLRNNPGRMSLNRLVSRNPSDVTFMQKLDYRAFRT